MSTQTEIYNQFSAKMAQYYKISTPEATPMFTAAAAYFIAPRYDRGPPVDPLDLDLSDGGNKIAAKIRRELIRQKLCGTDGRAESLCEHEEPTK